MFKILTEAFKALSDETRLRILGLLLLEGELCVCDVEGTLGVTQSKASRHLRYLYNAGLVENRRVGAWVHYRLPDAPDPARERLIDTLRQLLPAESLADLQKQLAAWRARSEQSQSSAPPRCEEVA